MMNLPEGLKTNIIIINDDDDLLDMIGTMFSSDRFRLTKLKAKCLDENRPEIEEIFSESRPDVALIDIPFGGNLRPIKEISKKFGDCSVLATTRSLAPANSVKIDRESSIPIIGMPCDIGLIIDSVAREAEMLSEMRRYGSSKERGG